MSRKKWNSMKLGLLLGILWPFLIMTGIYFTRFSTTDFKVFWHKLFEMQIFTKYLSISVYPNLLLFFIFIWRNLLLSARGVLLATFLYGFVVIIFKFLI